jgi:hypothetical protein
VNVVLPIRVLVLLVYPPSLLKQVVNVDGLRALLEQDVI